MLVWNYKRNAIPMDQVSILKDQPFLLGSSSTYNRDNDDQKNKEEDEDSEDGLRIARM